MENEQFQPVTTDIGNISVLNANDYGYVGVTSINVSSTWSNQVTGWSFVFILEKNETFTSFIRSEDWVLFGVQFHRNARLFLGVRLENGCNPGRHFGCGPNLAFFDDEPFVPVLSMAPPRWNESPAEFHWIIIAVSVCWQQINFFYWLAPSKLLFSATLTGQPMENFRWFAAIFLRHSSAVISFYQCWTRRRPWLVKYCVKCAESRNALAPAAILDPTSCNFSCQQNRVTWTQNQLEGIKS